MSYTVSSEVQQALNTLLDNAQVKQAVAFAEEDQPRCLEEHIRLTEIEAPTYEESARAEAFAELLRQEGLEDVHIGKGGNVIGNKTRVKVVKNKVAPPFRKCELDIYFGKGISASASLLDSAVKHGIIDKRGAWYTMGETKVGQGKENAVQFIEQNPEIAAEVEKKIREIVFPGQTIKNKEEDSGKKSKKAAAAATSADNKDESLADGLF